MAERHAGEVRATLVAFLEPHLRTEITPDLDLFASGGMSSLFALELVVHLERSFGVAVEGPDLQLANFRTVDAMTALVLRLGEANGG